MATMVAVKKAERVTPEVLILDKDNSIVAQFARWFYSKTADLDGQPNGRVLSMDDCGAFLDRLRESRSTENDVRGTISKARRYLEKQKVCTIWNVRGRGWRITNKIEVAKTYGKSMSRTLAHVDRTLDLRSITEAKYIPYAMKEVTKSCEGKMQGLGGEFRKRFVQALTLTEKKEQKQLEDGKNEK